MHTAQPGALRKLRSSMDEARARTCLAEQVQAKSKRAEKAGAPRSAPNMSHDHLPSMPPLFCCCGCMRMPGMRMAMLGNSAKKIQVDCSSLHLIEAVVHICFMLDPLSAACLARLHLPHHLRHDPKQGNPRPGGCSQARTLKDSTFGRSWRVGYCKP